MKRKAPTTSGAAERGISPLPQLGTKKGSVSKLLGIARMVPARVDSGLEGIALTEFPSPAACPSGEGIRKALKAARPTDIDFTAFSAANDGEPDFAAYSLYHARTRLGGPCSRMAREEGLSESMRPITPVDLQRDCFAGTLVALDGRACAIASPLRARSSCKVRHSGRS